MRKNPIALPLLAVLCLVSGMCFNLWAAEPTPPRPNVVFLLADDMGFSDLGCYGAEHIQTPNLDRLAGGGLRFSQFYNSARCWPSRTALLSGFHPQQMHADNFPDAKIMRRPNELAHKRVADKLVTHRLREAGYRTYWSGKHHIVFHRLDTDGPRGIGHLGFDRAYQLHDSNRFFSPTSHFDDDTRLPQPSPDGGYYATTAIADKAIGFLQDHSAKHAEKPFLLYVAFNAPHFPLQALPEDIEKYRNAFLEGWDNLRARRAANLAAQGGPTVRPAPLASDIHSPCGFGANAAGARQRINDNEVVSAVPWDSLAKEQKRFQATKMAIHAAMVDRMDREIGRIVAQLKAMKAYENTLILFASDNGADATLLVRGDQHDRNAPPGSAGSYLCLGPGWSSASNSPFHLHKMFTHEGGTATPMIAHWPAGIRDAGVWRTTPAHFVDIAPTLIRLAGGEWDGTPSPGIDLTSVLTKNTGANRKEPFWWCHKAHNGRFRKAIRDGDWKAVLLDDGDWQLYNLTDDRGETTDLAAQHPERLEALKARWQARKDAILEQIRK